MDALIVGGGIANTFIAAEGYAIGKSLYEPDLIDEAERKDVSVVDNLEEEGQLSVDVYQDRDNVIIKSTIAGVRPEDIDVTIANDMVTIRGERKRDFEASSEDYFYQECYWGSFSRSVVLPVDVDIENVGADLKDGILTVILPKAAKSKARKIKVGNKL